jgi:hypothetical protein
MSRADFAAIQDDLQFVMSQLARLPTRKEQARTALGIIFARAMLTTPAVLRFHQLLGLLPMTRVSPIFGCGHRFGSLVVAIWLLSRPGR